MEYAFLDHVAKTFCRCTGSTLHLELLYSSLKPWGCVSRRGPEGEEGGRWDILQGPQAQEAAQPELWQAL